MGYEWIGVDDALAVIARASEMQGRQKAGAGRRLAEQLHTVSASVLRETEYVDRDYSAAYLALYGRQFRPPQKLATRYHFFRTSIDSIDLIDESTYLGFVVIWPTIPSVLGRTCLRPSLWGLERPSVQLVSVPVRINVAGKELTIQTCTYASKDFGVSACATMAAWLATEVLAAYGEIPRTTSTALTLAASHNDATFGRALPQVHGLTVDQIARGLQASGLDPYVYDHLVGNEWHRRATIGAHIDSGIPLVATVQWGLTSHALLIVGYEVAPNFHELDIPDDEKRANLEGAIGAWREAVQQRPETIPEARYKVGEQFNQFHRSKYRHISKLIVHDDRYGAFIEVSLREDDPQLKNVNYEPIGQSFEVHAVIAPLPIHINSLSYDAYVSAKDLFADLLMEESAPPPEPMHLTTRLIRSNDLKAAAWEWLPDVSASLRETSLPRWVWVTEACRQNNGNTSTVARWVSDPTVLREADQVRILWWHYYQYPMRLQD